MSRQSRNQQGLQGPLGAFATVLTGIFALPFIGFGLFAAAEGIQQWSAGDGEGIFFLIFGLVFAGFGVGIFAMARRARRGASEIAEQLDQHRDTPWLLNEAWASGRIEGAGPRMMWVSWTLALVWSAVSLPLLFAVPEEVGRGNDAALLGLLFPISGLALLAWAGVTTARYRRFGRTRLELRTMPAVLGGELRASLISQKPLPREADVQIALRNIRRTVSRSGNSRSVSERVLWEDSVEVPGSRVTRRAQGHGLDVEMQIPFDTRASDPLPDNDCILWRLLFRADLAGADFSDQFEIPVFETPESDATLTSGMLSRKRSQGQTLRREGEENASEFEMRPSPGGGLELYFPPARNKGAALGISFIVAAFAGATWLLQSRSPFFGVVFGLVTTLFFAGALNMWLGSLRVAVEARGVSLTKKLLGIGGTRFVAREDIAAVSIESGMRAGDTTYWDVRLRKAGQEERIPGPRIGPSIRDRSDAERLSHRVEDILGLSA